MADYISREALISKFKQIGLGDYSLVEKIFSERVCAVIDTFPAADVAQVRHGRSLRTWIDEYYGEWTECSVCGWDNPANAQYCNGCGAKMDGSGGNG